MNIGSYALLMGRPKGHLGWWPRLGLGACGLLVLWWAARGSQVSFGELTRGLPWIGDFLARMVPPNWAFLDKLWVPAIETVQIALWGTLLAVILAVPVCFFAARGSANPVFGL